MIWRGSCGCFESNHSSNYCVLSAWLGGFYSSRTVEMNISQSHGCNKIPNFFCKQCFKGKTEFYSTMIFRYHFVHPFLDFFQILILDIEHVIFFSSVLVILSSYFLPWYDFDDQVEY